MLLRNRRDDPLITPIHPQTLLDFVHCCLCAREITFVHDNDVGRRGLRCGRAPAVEQLALEGGAIGLRGTATELFDEEARHLNHLFNYETLYTDLRSWQRTQGKDSML